LCLKDVVQELVGIGDEIVLVFSRKAAGNPARGFSVNTGKSYSHSYSHKF